MSSRPHPRRPALLGPAALASAVGGQDPAERAEAAHLTAAALLRHGRGSGSAEETRRLVELTDVHGIDEVAMLWADRPADTLPGTLWRIYALRAGIRQDPLGLARAFDAGRARAEVHEVVAGVAEPPGPEQLLDLADAILTGVFTGDLAVALERAAAFCRVLGTGVAVLADGLADDEGERSTRRGADLVRTAGQLEHAATLWRMDSLH